LPPPCNPSGDGCGAPPRLTPCLGPAQEVLRLARPRADSPPVRRSGFSSRGDRHSSSCQKTPSSTAENFAEWTKILQRCHSQPFACHSERSEESPQFAQGKLREESSPEYFQASLRFLGACTFSERQATSTSLPLLLPPWWPGRQPALFAYRLRAHPKPSGGI